MPRNRMTEYFKELGDKAENGVYVNDVIVSVQPSPNFFGNNIIVTAEGTFDLTPPPDDDSEYFEQP